MHTVTAWMLGTQSSCIELRLECMGLQPGCTGVAAWLRGCRARCEGGSAPVDLVEVVRLAHQPRAALARRGAPGRAPARG
eukprot:scaffold90549_cov57-Phaeocystis_antarctica.AAC.1